MKNIAYIIFILILLGCTYGHYDPRLEGIWTSNKEVTLSKLSKEQLTEKQTKFLIENLGDLQFTFKGNKTALDFTTDPADELEFKTYKTTSININSVTIIPPEGTEKTLTFDDHCYYIVADWGYREYFCK